MFKFISSCLPIRKEKKSVKQVIYLELPDDGIPYLCSIATDFLLTPLCLPLHVTSYFSISYRMNSSTLANIITLAYPQLESD